MDWIKGIQDALEYIEDHIIEDLDCETLGKVSGSSSFHFQRVFSTLCGYTVGEYIRNRRLTRAGAELALEKGRVIDVAVKYGYDSPDSFARAFTKFHGITPSAAREEGAQLRSFSRISIGVSLEGGFSKDISATEYTVVQKPAQTLVGFKRRFTGTPDQRFAQEDDFAVNTRSNQYLLRGMARDCDTIYTILTNFDQDSYDYYLAAAIDEWEEYAEEIGEDAARFEEIKVPSQLYVVCETERTEYPTELLEDLRRKVIGQWLPLSGYCLAEAPEIAVIHWYYERNNVELNNSRYVELWLPIEKTE